MCKISVILLCSTSNTNAHWSQIKIVSTQGRWAHGKCSLNSGLHGPLQSTQMNVSCSCFEADKLIVETTLSWGSAEITLRGITGVAPPAPTLLRHRRHQLLTSACTRQIPRVSNRMVLEDSNWSLPRLTSFCHIYWCEDIVLDLELKMWDFDVIHSGNIFSVYKGSVCLLAHLPVI